MRIGHLEITPLYFSESCKSVVYELSNADTGKLMFAKVLLGWAWSDDGIRVRGVHCDDEKLHTLVIQKPADVTLGRFRYALLNKNGKWVSKNGKPMWYERVASIKEDTWLQGVNVESINNQLYHRYELWHLKDGEYEFFGNYKYINYPDKFDKENRICIANFDKRKSNIAYPDGRLMFKNWFDFASWDVVKEALLGSLKMHKPPYIEEERYFYVPIKGRNDFHKELDVVKWRCRLRESNFCKRVGKGHYLDILSNKDSDLFVVLYAKSKTSLKKAMNLLDKEGRVLLKTNADEIQLVGKFAWCRFENGWRLYSSKHRGFITKKVYPNYNCLRRVGSGHYALVEDDPTKDIHENDSDILGHVFDSNGKDVSGLVDGKKIRFLTDLFWTSSDSEELHEERRIGGWVSGVGAL